MRENRVRRDDMELSRAVSDLAAANQQLAAAHNLALGNLPWLLAELRKSRPSVSESSESRAKLGTCPNCGAKEIDARSAGMRVVIGKKKKLTRLKKLPSAARARNVETREIQKEICLSDLKSESQIIKDGFASDLEEQRLRIETLTQDYENSQRECERKEKSLELMAQKLNRSLAELETFQCQRNNAERMAKEEAEKSTTLRARLAEQDEERKKQLLALDEATQQIRALELALRVNNQSTSQTTKVESIEPEDLQSSASNLAASVNEFKKELTLKREARQRAIAAVSSEMDRLRRELEAEKIAHSETAKLLESTKETCAKAVAKSKTDDNDELDEKTDKKTSDRIKALRLSDLLKISDEVTSDLWLQLERTDDLRFQLENDPEEHRLRIGSLKRLSEETSATLRARKQQVNVLKDKLAQILVRLGDRSFLDESDEIREEVDRQIEDITRSRNLCDERSRILAELKDHCFKEIHELKVKFENSRQNNQSLEEDLRKTEDKMDAQDAEILNLESQLGLAKADCRDLQNQMSLINSLFTQMLLSASSAEMDLDRLTQLLQENHDLISGMAKENGTEAAALPKLLLDIIEQVDGRTRESEEKKEEDDLQEENIAHNLPKVWRVLLELLSCHAAGTSGANSASTVATESTPDSCYKSVDTPTGPRLVISVSKTYIRLKELILEKKHLEKEMNRMKQLNTHLESKLSEQEKRLSTVSDELSKTWNIVGRMQAQHQQLHTHEKILRYELQQKRKMLQELKQELEYCREKWESARQKNTNTEMEWRSLRREFAARKALATHGDSFNNSGESGFSDEREEESDEDEDDGDVGKRVRPINSRRRIRKDGSRAITPDTESEQPTDTEFSESKTASSLSGQRTPTPETETELENCEIIEEDPPPVTAIPNNPENPKEEILNPLDKALTTVIQSLIGTDESQCTESCTISDNSNTDTNVETVKKVENEVLGEKRLKRKEETELDTENSNESKTISEDSVKTNINVVSSIPVFTIGPVPSQLQIPKNVQFSNPLVIGPSSRMLELNENSSTSSTSAQESLIENFPVMTEEKDVSKASELISEADTISVDSSSSLETVKEFSLDCNDKSVPSTSQAIVPLKTDTKSNISEQSADIKKCLSDFPSTEVLDARAARLRSLEEQAQWLVKKVNDTNRRGSALNSRLEELHETYGSMPAAPPMPDVLPTFRLHTEINETPLQRDHNETSIQTNDSKDDTYTDGAP